MTAERRSVVLVDDDALTRVLLTELLESLDFDVIAANAVAPGLEAIRDTDPDLLMTDLDLGDGPTGVDLIRAVEKRSPWIAIVVLSMHRSTLLIDTESLPHNPRRVHLIKGDIKSADDLRIAIESATSGSGTMPSSNSLDAVITRDQAEVLRHMALGMSNKEIAAARGCSVRAVENTAQRMYVALGLAGNEKLNPRAAAIRMYQQALITVV